MRLRLIGVLVAIAVAMAPAFAVAQSAPHDRLDTNISCYYCHNLAVRTASGHLNYAGACLGCHNKPGHAFGMPWLESDQAKPGVTGNSHSWSGAVESPAHGATGALVANPGFIADGTLQCIVCHDSHSPNPAFTPSSMHTSAPSGTPQLKTGTSSADTTGSATLTLTATPSAVPTGVRLKIVTVNGSGGTFIYSQSVSWSAGYWYNWTGTAWTSGPETGPGRPFTNGVDVPLPSAGASVKWTAGARVGDYWDLYIAYPGSRYTSVADSYCTVCHQERAMNHVRARGMDRGYLPNGVRKFSHPIGVALNVNGFGTDRTRVLDADGTQVTDIEGKVGTSTSDGADSLQNATNDLILNGGIVQCTTCHRVHNADSNSLTRDAR
jgi:hypothetical protein